jgi:hypothetical protein
MKRSVFHLILSILLFLAALAAYAFWYHALAAARGEADTLAAELSAKGASVQNAQAASRALADLGSAQDDVKGYFVAPDGIVSFLEGLQSLGAKLGARVAVVSVSANAAPRPHLDLALSVTGSFASVMKTVGAIEYSPYDLVLKTVTIDTSSEGGQWTAALTAAVGTASSTPATKP